MRNPIDVIPSFANQALLKSHSLAAAEKYETDHPAWWDAWVDAAAKSMAASHEHIFSTVAVQIPTFVVRYEDLRRNATPVVTQLFQFLLDTPDLAGTLVEQRIKHAVQQDALASKVAYNTKTRS